MSTTNPRRRSMPLVEIFFAILIGLGCVVLLLSVVSFTQPSQTPVGLVTAMLTVILAPTDTPAPPTLEALTPTVMRDVPPEPGAGVLSIGNYVQVSGTEGDGLRLREGPGLSYDPQLLGLESEVFQIVDGPQQADGYTWWHLSAPYDQTRSGWAVSNYLLYVEQP